MFSVIFSVHLLKSAFASLAACSCLCRHIVSIRFYFLLAFLLLSFRVDHTKCNVFFTSSLSLVPSSHNPKFPHPSSVRSSPLKGHNSGEDDVRWDERVKCRDDPIPARLSVARRQRLGARQKVQRLPKGQADRQRGSNKEKSTEDG